MPRKYTRNTRESHKNFVLNELQKGTNMNTAYWRKKPELYRVLSNLAGHRKYFGHKTWDGYLEKEIGISRLRKAGKYLIPFHITPKSAESFVLARAKESISMNSSFWLLTPGLSEVIRYLRRRNFFGKGRWRKYLKSIGVKPFETEKYSRESLKSFVLNELQKGTNTSSNYWMGNKRLRAQLRKLYRKKFFGYKSWGNYLIKECGWKKH